MSIDIFLGSQIAGDSVGFGEEIEGSRAGDDKLFSSSQGDRKREEEGGGGENDYRPDTNDSEPEL